MSYGDWSSSCALPIFFYKSKNLPTADKAIDFWNRYPQDIKQMKNELGINSFRLSIAWDRIQPEQGIWDDAAIKIGRASCRERVVISIAEVSLTAHQLV